MKLTRRDLPKLWLPTSVMLTLLIVASLLAWGTHREATQATQELQVAKTARSQIEQRLRQVRTEEHDIKERTQLLQHLQQRGIAGDESRLEWMELLSTLQRELRLPGLKYEFGAQVPLDTGNSPPWQASPLRIQLFLLHEGDLLQFLDRIERQAKALVIVRSCKLAPLPAASDNRETFAQLGAECDMHWLTLHQPAGKP